MSTTFDPPPAPTSSKITPLPPAPSSTCKDMHRSDSVSGLVWRSGAFAGQFGDAFIQDTDLEGGQVAPSIEYLSEICETHLLATRRTELTMFNDKEMVLLHTIIADLKQAAQRDRILDGIRAKRGQSGLDNATFAKLLQSFVTELASLAPGQRLVVSGGWSGESGGHAIMHCVERENDGTYAIVTFNTGEGVGHHPSMKEAYPKEKSKCAMRFTGITPKRMLDPSIWYLFFNIKVTGKKENVPAMIYDVVLPFLNNGQPIGESVDRDLDTSGWWESQQLAGTCYYRCILCSIRYLMKKDGFTQTQQKQLFVHIRASFLDQIVKELETKEGVADLRTSDVKMINMGCSQTLYAAMKLSKREGIDGHGMLRLEQLVESIRDKVDNTLKVDEVANELLPLGLENSAPLLPFPNFELIRTIGVEDPEIYAGGETEATPDLFVELTHVPQMKNMKDYCKTLELCAERCVNLRAKTAVCAATIALHQICALISRTFMEVLPFPPARGTLPPPLPTGSTAATTSVSSSSSLWFHTTFMVLPEQRACLKCLSQLMRAYVTA